MLWIEILNIKRRFGPKEHLNLLKRLIDNVLLQMMRTKHYLNSAGFAYNYEQPRCLKTTQFKFTKSKYTDDVQDPDFDIAKINIYSIYSI